jgi:hypothetical protein
MYVATDDLGYQKRRDHQGPGDQVVMLGRFFARADSANVAQGLAGAADLVLATAHLDGGQAATPLAQWVVDIDLAILGSDPQRFMDFDYAVEEEYASVTTSTFRVRRGAFLASLLRKPSVFSTPYFREHREARARSNIEVLLSPPRATASTDGSPGFSGARRSLEMGPGADPPRSWRRGASPYRWHRAPEHEPFYDTGAAPRRAMRATPCGGGRRRAPRACGG